MLRAKATARRLAAAFWKLRSRRADPACSARRFELDVDAAFKGVLKQDRKWITYLARKTARNFGNDAFNLADVQRFILSTRVFRAAGRVLFPPRDAAQMQPARGAPERWALPQITTLSDLAAWLNLTAPDLYWFADTHNLERAAAGKLQHYRRHWRQKADGSFRLIESPKQRMKLIQRALLREIIERIPPHDASHGFRKGRSIFTFTQTHAGQAVVIKIDLRNFFPTISLARIQNIFSTAGYPDAVAAALASFCATYCPSDVIAQLPVKYRREARDLYARQHLPQGAPTSPALANLAAFNLDCRLAGVAKSMGAVYTRYADDLLFSGNEEFSRDAHRFVIWVAAIALEEGFEVHHRKTKVMRQGVRQRAAGLVLNAKPNCLRRDFDELKAILTNAGRHGLESQNRGKHPHFAEHLRGRISFIAQSNIARGEKLTALFEKIAH